MKKHLKKAVFIFVLLLMSAMLVLGVSAKYSPRWVIEDMVRTTDEPGIRFSVKIDSALRNDEKLEEYGFIAIASKKLEEGGESISGFGLDCTLDYLRGVAFGVAEDGSRIDLLRKDDGAKATFSCVIHSIPVEHYKSGIVAKAYLIYDGEVYYSTAFKVNYLGAARNMKNGEEYEKLDENAKKIIDDILLKSGVTDDGEDDVILPEPVEPTEHVGIISNYDIGEDADGNWRIFYEVYNPYTAMKEYDIPSVRCSEKAKELSDGLEAGTLVKICDGFIDDTNEDKILGGIEIPNMWSWVTSVDLENGSMNVCSAAYDFCGLELERSICDRSGFTDIYGNIYDDETLVKLADDAKISVLKYDTPEDTFNWGVMSGSSLEELAEAHKSLRGYNEASVNDDGDYVTTYNKYVKCYVSVSGKDSDGTPVADFVIVVVNGHETATEGTYCIWCAHEESVNKEAIVTSFDVMEDEQGKFRLYYDLYCPVTGISQKSIPSKEVYNTASSAANAAYSEGTIAIVSGGYVRKKVCDIGLDGLVWIGESRDDGVLSVVPFDYSLKCKDCIKEYVEGFDGEECTDIHGHSVNSVIDAGNAIFTAVLSSDFETLFTNPQFGSVRYDNLSLYKCMNDKALDEDGNYYTGQSDYVKAYISANKGMSGESEAEYVLVVVNGNENAALDEKCEKHAPVIQEPDEEPDTEEDAVTYAVISDSAVDVDENGKYRVYYDVCNLGEGEKQSGIPSARFAESASELSDILESGTIITMESEFIDDTNRNVIKGKLSEDNLVWIANVKDDGTLVAAPYDGSYTCPGCVLYYCMIMYVTNNETGVMDMFGEKTDGNFFKLTENTSVVKISYSEYSDNMFKYGSIEKKQVSDLSIKGKELLCYNENAQKADGSYTTGYTRFKKAFVAVNEKNEAEVVVVVVNGGENSALGEYCERDEGYISTIPDEWK